MKEVFDMGFGVFDSMFVIVPVLIVIIFIVLVIRSAMEWHANNQQPIIPARAKIVAKRANTSMHNSGNDMPSSASTTYYATFEFTNGERTELCVNGREYGQLAEGDQGVLSMQGTRYIGFERE